MLKHNLGYPRVGPQRQLKKFCEQYWNGVLSRESLFLEAHRLREENWRVQVDSGLDLIPAGDFSLYDHVLDMSLLLGAIPARYTPVLTDVAGNTEVDLYFAMARGCQRDGLDITAMEMTKWFDTNYHYIVPEFTAGQTFSVFSHKLFGEVASARHSVSRGGPESAGSGLREGPTPAPSGPPGRAVREASGSGRAAGTASSSGQAAVKAVLIGPVSYLLLGKEKEPGFHRIDLIRRLVPVYIEILKRLEAEGVTWVQMDEPFLVMDLGEKERAAFRYAYDEIRKACPDIKILLTTYFGSLGDNTELALRLPVAALHLDLVRNPEQLEDVLIRIPSHLTLSLGVVDGRNIWKNDYERSHRLIESARSVIGGERIMLAPSCSLLHVPIDLDLEKNIPAEIRNWMAFANQKLREIGDIERGASNENEAAMASRRTSPLIHRPEVKARVQAEAQGEGRRMPDFATRQRMQQTRFGLPFFPTTTIGSFPQTEEIRGWRARFKRGDLTQEAYEENLEKATLDCIRTQEDLGLDVLVHGEFERNDMVEYFGGMLEGFLFTAHGWVQSYGSRCVKPPVIFGDVARLRDMTVRWTRFAQQATVKPMKGMLTGPVTILQWSFVRDDQPRWETAFQIALAIRDEVRALERAGIGMIQVDEPAIREGLPLRIGERAAYLDWAVKAFRLSVSEVDPATQIHTHMCYSDFNDIIAHIADMDADVITIETSRSQMELLEAFSGFRYPGEIGPGVYDIHSPRVPATAEMVELLEKAAALLPARNLWVNPDCGLKTRRWPETLQALENMVAAAKIMRERT